MENLEEEQLQRLKSKAIEAMKEWMAEELNTQKLRVEVGGHFDAAHSERIKRQLDAEEQAMIRYQEAHKEYRRFLGLT